MPRHDGKAVEFRSAMCRLSALTKDAVLAGFRAPMLAETLEEYTARLLDHKANVIVHRVFGETNNAGST